LQLEALRCLVPGRILAAAYAAVREHLDDYRHCPRIARLAEGLS
jgi:hypothetical protein